MIAVREALINAISHRDYTNQSGSISFAIFDDRLEIWSNGTLPPELQLKDLKTSHESFPRNKRVAKIFYSRGWVEKAGIGTIRMIEDCKKLGLPEPKFKEYSSGFAVIFWFKEPIGGAHIVSQYELTLLQREMLDLLKKSPLNSAQVAEMLSNKPTQRTAQQYLLQLEKAGFVKREGKARMTVWILVKDQ